MESYQYSVNDIAIIIIRKMRVKYEEDISYWKLQKLLYYAQGFTMAYTGKKLFNESIVKNEMGLLCKDLETNLLQNNKTSNDDLPEYLNNLLENIIVAMGDFKLHELEEILYREESRLEYLGGKEECVVSDESIKIRFNQILEKG